MGTNKIVENLIPLGFMQVLFDARKNLTNLRKDKQYFIKHAESVLAKIKNQESGERKKVYLIRPAYLGLSYRCSYNDFIRAIIPNCYDILEPIVFYCMFYDQKLMDNFIYERNESVIFAMWPMHTDAGNFLLKTEKASKDLTGKRWMVNLFNVNANVLSPDQWLLVRKW
jgi:hypothetical protein